MLTNSLFSQSQDTKIKDYFNSLNNKTIVIEIFENQSVFNAKISLNDSKIYFETIEGSVICIVDCKKSSEPVFCKFKGEEEKPFVRYGSSTTAPVHSEWTRWEKKHF